MLKCLWRTFDSALGHNFKHLVTCCVFKLKKKILATDHTFHHLTSITWLTGSKWILFVFSLQPATVSRCGMIYMEPSQLGWEPLVISWTNSLPDPLQSPDNRSLLLELFHWLLPAALRTLRKNCRVSGTGPQNNQDTNISRTLTSHFIVHKFIFICLYKKHNFCHASLSISFPAGSRFHQQQ